MARFADLLISGGFATGVAHYDDRYPGYEQSARVVVPVTVEGHLTVLAIVDTGAPWCILAPEIAEEAGAEISSGYRPAKPLGIRGFQYEGTLMRMRIGLQATYGEDLEIEATVFVPTLAEGEVWIHPNFLGLDGFLNRSRFAVDPSDNAFYFGPL